MASPEELIQQLQSAIKAQESLRPTLGDSVVDTTIAALRSQLRSIIEQQETKAPHHSVEGVTDGPRDPAHSGGEPAFARNHAEAGREDLASEALGPEELLARLIPRELADKMRASLEADIRQVDEEYSGRSDTARGLAKMPYARELHALKQRYGKDLDTYSHGESFLKFFQARFIPSGLYLLDEPEAPLSPLRQLALISLLKQMIAEDAQFMIATHSPLIMAFPGAVILSFDRQTIQPISYEQTEHYTLTRTFLNNPEKFLREL